MSHHFEEYFTQWKQKTENLKTIEDVLLFLNDFQKAESNTNFIQQPQYQKQYVDFITQLKDQFLFPLFAKMQFSFGFFKMIALAKPLLNRLPKHKDYKRLEEFLDKQKKQIKQPLHQFALTSVVFWWRALNGEFDRAKRQWLKDLSKIDPTQLNFSEDVINLFIESFLIVFPDVSEALSIYKEEVLNDAFFELSVHKQQRCLIWISNVFWNVYGSHKGFQDLFPRLVEILERGMQDKNHELVFSLFQHLTTIWRVPANTTKEFVEFNEKAFSKYIEYIKAMQSEWHVTPCHKTDITSKKLKIGFFVDRLTGNSPCKILFSLLFSLGKFSTNDLEVIVYDHNLIEKEKTTLDAIVLQHGAKYVDLHRHCFGDDLDFYYSRFEKIQKSHERILEDHLDVFIAWGQDDFTAYHLLNRVAPLQLYWKHSFAPSILEEIDFNFTHSTLPTSKKGQKIEGTDVYFYQQAMLREFYDPPVEDTTIKKLRQKFPEDKILLGCISSSMKIGSKAYLETVFQIMHKNPNTVYIACGGGSFSDIKNEFKKNKLGDRLFSEGHIDPHLYGHVIDIFLDTFPLNNGESIAEYRAKGGVCVKLLEERPDLERVKAYDWILEKYKEKVVENGEVYFRIPLTFSMEEYVETAIRLIRDPILREKVGVAEKILFDETFFNMQKQAESFTQMIKFFIEQKFPSKSSLKS